MKKTTKYEIISHCMKESILDLFLMKNGYRLNDNPFNNIKDFLTIENSKITDKEILRLAKAIEKAGLKNFKEITRKYLKEINE